MSGNAFVCRQFKMSHIIIFPAECGWLHNRNKTLLYTTVYMARINHYFLNAMRHTLTIKNNCTLCLNVTKYITRRETCTFCTHVKGLEA